MTLATSNDYQGGTTINDNGKIVALDVGSTGNASATGTGPVTVGTNATLQIGDGATAGAGSVTGPVHNSGSVVINRPDSFTFATPVDGSGTLTVQGGGTPTVSGTLTYTGKTNVTNGTLLAGAANAFSPASTIVLSDSATSNVDFGSQPQNVGALSGGGATGGTVNANAAITFTGSGTNTFLGTFNGGASAINMSSAGLVQNLNGTVNVTGPITVNNGNLGFSPTADTAIGGGAINVGAAGSNNGTLTIGPHAMVTASALTVGANNGTNGIGTVVQTGGLLQSNGAVNLGNNGGSGTLNLSGGTFNSGAMNMATNGAASSATIIIGAGEQANIINGNIVMGQFFNPPSTITVNGGSLTLATDTTGTPNPTGVLRFQNNNAQNMGTYTVNLNGGVLTAGGMEISVTADSSGTGNFNLNRRPTINFNGGTLRSGSDTANFFNPAGTGSAAAATIAGGGNPFATNVLAGGGTIDTNGHSVGISTNLAHGGTATVDGGMTFTDSQGTAGILTLTGTNSYNGGTTINSGTVVTGAPAVAAQSNLPAGTTNASATVTMANSAGLVVGQPVSGTGIPANTYIATITATGITISNNATATNAANSLSFGAVGSLGTGPIKINTGGTLQLGLSNSINVANSIPNSSNLTLSGGTFLTAGLNETLGKLKNASASTIDLGTGSTVLQLSDSSTSHWVAGTTTSGATLHIANWSGLPTGGGTDQITFPSLTSLTSNQLNQIVFDGSGLAHAKLIAAGAGAELVPTNTAPTGVLSARRCQFGWPREQHRCQFVDHGIVGSECL